MGLRHGVVEFELLVFRAYRTGAAHSLAGVDHQYAVGASRPSCHDAITLDFVVDSGAADVSIPVDVVMTLMRMGTVKESNFRGEKTYELVNGLTFPSQTFRIRSLRVGNKVLEDVTGGITTVQGSLLLGQSFVSRFQSWSVDNTKHALLLSE